MPTPFSHCHFCGAAYPADTAGFPRTCTVCSSTTYRNPLPVAVVLIPVEAGLVGIRRTIPPHVGKFALPGGFINYGESWQTAGVREVQEETGLVLDESQLTLYAVRSAPDGTLLVFMKAQGITLDLLTGFAGTDETDDISVITDASLLAFPLHAEVASLYFQGK